MAIRRIIHYGHPTLRKKAKQVSKPDSPLVRLSQDMIETMRAAGGVGLAANQIDALVSVVVLDLSTEEARVDPVVLLNPRIVESSIEDWEFEEGCLSVPEVRHLVRRPASVTVEAWDLEGKPVVINKAEGLLARVLQHEIDHLNGSFFVDHLTPEQRTELKAALKKIEKDSKRQLKKG